MTFMRRSSRLLLSLIALCLATASLAMVALHESIGTPERAAATVGAVIDSEHGPETLGAAFVAMLKDTGGNDVQITASDEELAKAAGAAITASRGAIVAAVQQAYTASLTGQAATIDLSPVIAAIAAELHAVDAGIPADIGKGGDGPGAITIAARTDPPLAKANKALGFWWLGLLASALALAGIGLLSPNRGWRRWRVTGILLAIVGSAWLVAAKAGPDRAIARLHKDVERDLAKQVSEQLAGHLLTVGGLALVAGAVLIGMSFRPMSRAGAHTGSGAVIADAPGVSDGSGSSEGSSSGDPSSH